MSEQHDHPTMPSGENPKRPPSADLPVQRIGPYRLLERIGQGSMGEVYLAEQTEPIRRNVALKIIKIGMDTKDAIARFDAERQALALMEHPCIAKVLDAGATEQGRPYFVMEYVPGIAITQYCDTHRLSIRDRLLLFTRVCEGVQHAHQKAIIHRDLKPSNILVFEQDGRAVPKIIDFGIAKAMAQRLTEQTIHTEVGHMIGTLGYMSPEQAEIGPDNVDTRTDIYSLGAILYELLIGVLPFDQKELRRAGFHEVQRKMREDEPPRPSTRVSGLGMQSTLNAERRGVDPIRFQSIIRGDLDWITMKALEKDRARRYETANGLAMDIQRYLSNEPVLATPPSTVYRLRKLVRRNRGAVAAAAAILVILVGATVLSTMLYVRAGHEAARARTEATRSDQVATFMRSMLKGVGPSVARGRDIKLLREILDDTAKRLGTQLGDQPLVRADMLSVLGETYRDLGEYAAAEPHLNEALALQRSVNGERHPKSLEAMSSLANLYYNLGRFQEADSILTWAGDVQTEILGPENPATLSTKSARVSVLAYGGRFDEAAKLGEQILAPLRRVEGDASTLTLTAMYTMAQVYADQQKFARAESLYIDLIEIQHRTYGDDYPHLLSTKVGYGWLLRMAKRLPEAEAMTSETLRAMRRVFGSDHSETMVAINNLGIILNDQGKFAEAEPYYVESLESGKRVLGEKHPETVVGMVNLGTFYLKAGRYTDGEAILTHALDIFHETMPPDHIGTGIARSARGDCRVKLGREAAALTDHLAAFEILSKHNDMTHPRLQRIVENIAVAYERRGEQAQAQAWRSKLTLGAP